MTLERIAHVKIDVNKRETARDANMSRCPANSSEQQRLQLGLTSCAPPTFHPRRVATAPMQLFNSPWGTFARHVWGGNAAILRQFTFDDELKVRGVLPPKFSMMSILIPTPSLTMASRFRACGGRGFSITL